jgi:hypothetical protein
MPCVDRDLERSWALGLAEFLHSGLPWMIVICSRQGVVEVDPARALRSCTM